MRLLIVIDCWLLLLLLLLLLLAGEIGRRGRAAAAQLAVLHTHALAEQADAVVELDGVFARLEVLVGHEAYEIAVAIGLAVDVIDRSDLGEC